MQREFSVLAEGRHILGRRPNSRAAGLLDINVLIPKVTAWPRTEDAEKEMNKKVIHILVPISRLLC